MLPDLAITRRRSAISLTPLIDVVFILLLFFMLSSQFMQWRQVTLSSASHQGDNPAVNLFTIEVLNNQGLIEFEGQQGVFTELAGLQNKIGSEADALFVIDVAPDVTTQSVIDLLDQLKLAGAQHISLAGVTE